MAAACVWSESDMESGRAELEQALNSAVKASLSSKVEDRLAFIGEHLQATADKSPLPVVHGQRPVLRTELAQLSADLTRILNGARRAGAWDLRATARAIRAAAPRTRAREEAVLPRDADSIRVMTWNVLADGLSDDGFHLRNVLDVEGGRDMDEDYLALLAQLEGARGNVDALLQLKDAFSSEHVVANHRAVLDRQRRWCRFREMISSHRPDVIAFQEMDMMRAAVDALAPLGYVCSASGAAAVCSATERDGEVSDSGDVDADAAAYLDHVQRVGVAFAPKVGSVCRKLALANGQPEADDDGVALFWRDEVFELTQLDFRCLIDPKRECRLKGTVGVQLRRRVDGCPLSLLTAHITSGTDDKSEQMRIDELNVPSIGVDGAGPSLLQAFAANAQSMATVLALDANSGPDRSQPDVWKALRSAPGVAGSVWDELWSAEGKPYAESCVVTSNKMRGPLSAQPKKIGEHIFQCCDMVFFNERMAMQRHVFEPLAFEDAMAGKQALLPTLDMPSDHSPVCVDLVLKRSASTS